MKSDPSLLVSRRSGINGRGCFTTVAWPARGKVGELKGERICNREAARRVARGGKVRVCEIDDEWSVDASVGGDATAFINHSCDPSCFSRVLHGHFLIFARRAIRAGEELTIDYTPSQHPGRPCRCGARNCQGVMC